MEESNQVLDLIIRKFQEKNIKTIDDGYETKSFIYRNPQTYIVTIDVSIEDMENLNWKSEISKLVDRNLTWQDNPDGGQTFVGYIFHPEFRGDSISFWIL